MDIYTSPVLIDKNLEVGSLNIADFRSAIPFLLYKQNVRYEKSRVLSFLLYSMNHWSLKQMKTLKKGIAKSP